MEATVTKDNFLVPRSFWVRAFAAVLIRPRLWITAVVCMLRATPNQWWERPPFLPVPDVSFLRFRFETAYGRNGKPQASDFVAYLEWCRTRRG